MFINRGIMMIGAVLCVLLLGLTVKALSWWRGEIDLTRLKPGDIIFQESTSSQSSAIALATHSRYTHMGIIYINGSDYFVLEATQPVKLTDLHTWINRGKDKHIVVKRLAHTTGFSPNAIARSKAIVKHMEGKEYDAYFEWSDDRLYCSELVWKIYKQVLHIELAPLRTLGSLDLSSAEVRKKLAERYGDSIPLEQPVVTPADIFESGKLITVLED